MGPDIGALAEGPSERPGRMSEPDAIFAAAERLLAGNPANSKWSGKRVVVTAGPTREHLDPVRVITNPSSGRMGYALAEAARARGADVVLVTGPTELAPPAGLATTHVETTEEMQRALQGLVTNADALIMSAAPADYRHKTPALGRSAHGGAGSDARHIGFARAAQGDGGGRVRPRDGERVGACALEDAE